MFKLEQEIYNREGIDWKNCSYQDNQRTIDMIDHDKKISIFQLLEEQYRRGDAGSDQELFHGISNRLNQANQQEVYPPEKDPYSKTRFTIRHFAGEVTYTVTDFVEKNKDSKSEFINQTLAQSGNKLIASLYSNKVDNGGSQKIGGFTLCKQFKGQLNKLVETLSMSEPRYVRCIKPNNTYSPIEFQSTDVLRQLKCAGMIEAITIRKAGFAFRIAKDQFVKRYRPIMKGNVEQLLESPSDACINIRE